MTVKSLKISILEDDGLEYGIPTEMDLLNAIRGIKFGGFQTFYIDNDEELEIQPHQSYTVSNTMYINGTINIDGVLGVN